jgi:hypothetical protein
VTYIQKEKDGNKNYTIINIPDELWGEIRNVLPKEKHPKPQVVQLYHTEKCLMVFYISLELDINGRCCLQSSVLVLLVTEDIRNGIKLTSSKRYGSNY